MLGNRALTRNQQVIETCRRSAKTTVDRDTILAARCSAIQGLHSMLAQPDTSTSDGAIGAVVNLVMNDICFGEVRELRVHVEGAREMVRARGGLAALEAKGNLAKMLLIPPAPIPTLNPTTTAIFKDTDFLLDAVLALPPEPSAWQLHKVQTMSEWVQGRLSGASAKKTTSPSSTSANLHRAVRLSSLLYCRAIQARQPFSQAIPENDVLELAEAVWAVPLETWDAMPWTLVSVLAVGLPTARSIPQCGSARMMLVTAAVQLALRDWGAVMRVMGRVVRLQAWLRGPRGGVSG
ncbi:hypothetical protein C8A01DRAFT_15480 [Parachaetomium inaequale]|uniref:Uncharacterized protein n=1 Tax=Parachaetomium inaequale TaxID=2588326 RepID=A0AAN6PGN7_9PEZI|nr:hypothetical protein C8A01DRAFT_15480 [Parachaetomium inaequale]